jgi:hypothetical protein
MEIVAVIDERRRVERMPPTKDDLQAAIAAFVKERALEPQVAVGNAKVRVSFTSHANVGIAEYSSENLLDAGHPAAPVAISRTDRNLLDFPHRRRLAGSRRFVNPLSATEH